MSREPASKPELGSIHEARVDKLAVGGDGLCRINGFVIFVPDSAPGDLLKIRIASLDDRHGHGEIVEILEHGPGRREPPCVFARECGGCNWQHLTEAAQIEQKQLMLSDLIAKFLPGIPVPLSPMIPSPRSLHYRNRIQPHVGQGGRLGFQKRRSHNFVPVDDCLLVEDPLRKYFATPTGAADGERVELRLQSDGSTALYSQKEERSFSFSQVNRFQNEQLVETALRWTDGSTPTEIWDLYSGAGNFTFPLAKKFSDTPVVGVEFDAALVRRARESKSHRGNALFFVSDVNHWMRRKIPLEGALVVLDPPRAGAGRDVMVSLSHSKLSQLVYIACHPVSLVRDLKYFLDIRPDFRIRRIQGFEMFPQTDHFEVMAHLSVDTSV